MDDGDLLAELVRVATRLGADVRIEPFETPPARGGGRCLVDGRAVILLDAHAPLRDRVGALAMALAGYDLDDVYMTPDARDRVERERDARVTPREGVALAPLSTLGVGGPARFYVEARDETTVLAAARLGPRRASCRSGSWAAAPTWSSPTRASTVSSSEWPSGASPRGTPGRRSSSPRRRASRGTTWSASPSSGDGPGSNA